jgi:hypothetical protein
MMALLSWAAKRLGSSCSQGRSAEQQREEEVAIEVRKHARPFEAKESKKIAKEQEKTIEDEETPHPETSETLVRLPLKRTLLFDIQDYPENGESQNAASQSAQQGHDDRELVLPESPFASQARSKVGKQKRHGDYRVVLHPGKLKTSPFFNN